MLFAFPFYVVLVSSSDYITWKVVHVQIIVHFDVIETNFLTFYRFTVYLTCTHRGPSCRSEESPSRSEIMFDMLRLTTNLIGAWVFGSKTKLLIRKYIIFGDDLKETAQKKASVDLTYWKSRTIRNNLSFMLIFSYWTSNDIDCFAWRGFRNLPLLIFIIFWSHLFFIRLC